MDYDFFRFSPESFEQFARAIAVAVLGNNVRAFGDGPDGGREAMFHGEVSYKAHGLRNWNGYGVIQAKYKAKTEGTVKDQKWLLDCLDEELNLFESSPKRNPKPNYYLLITNVSLTSGSNGGKAKVGKVFQAFAKRLPLRQGDVWDSNQLRPYLDLHETIRTRYAHFLTPGDLIALLMKLLNTTVPHLDSILTSYLTSELRQESVARLDQAGNRTDDKLAIAKLFFDIPATSDAAQSPSREKQDDEGRLPPGVMAEMLRAVSRKLDPITVEADRGTPDGGNRLQTRFLLQGGPGSGKTTLGLFLAQIHRAAILQRMDQALLDDTVRANIVAVEDACARESLPWPTTPRYPFRVELNSFAKDLATEGCGITSFAAYLLRQLRGNHALDHATLLACFEQFPTLIVLDGLDEVPVTSNRADVIRSIRNFFDEIRSRNADVFVVATTRVQGYQNEFEGDDVATRYVSPLSVQRALRYVKAYAQSQFGQNEPDKASRIVKTIEAKAGNHLASQLMSTPLQVTFLAMVVAVQGDPGENRWQLYHSYFETIYARELQKAVPPFNDVLRDHKSNITRLHQIVGFWLQYLGEITAKESTSIKVGRFATLAQQLLARDGFEGAELTRLMEGVDHIARERLIFLTHRVDGEMAFEVRSLQEFMASECLMNGERQMIKQRLIAICGTAHWRNVMLFTAHKCFADHNAAQFQEFVRLLPVDLNEQSQDAGFHHRPGSDLALDLLQGGAAANNPSASRQLANIALELIDNVEVPNPFASSGHSVAGRLQSIYSDKLENAFRERIQTRIQQTSFRDTLGAWPLLVRLHSAKIDWTQELVSTNWPSQIDHLKALAPYLWDELLPSSLERRLGEALLQLTPTDAHSILIHFQRQKRDLFSERREPASIIDCLLYLFLRNRGFVEIPITVHKLRSRKYSFRLASISSPKRAKIAAHLFAVAPQSDPSWLPLRYLPEFDENPSLPTLIKILGACANHPRFKKVDGRLLSMLPWPIGVALAGVKTGGELPKLIEDLKARSKKSQPNWVAMEQKICLRGVKIESVCSNNSIVDVLAPLDKRRPSLPDQAIIGWSTSYSEEKLFSEDSAIVWSTISSAPDSSMRSFLASQLFDSEGVSISADILQAALKMTKVEPVGFAPPEFASVKAESMGEWLQLFSALGNHPLCTTSEYFPGSNISQEWIEELQNGFRAATLQLDRHGRISSKLAIGLLLFMSTVVPCGGRFDRIPRELLEPDKFSQAPHRFAALLVRLSQQTLLPTEVSMATQITIERLLNSKTTVDSSRLFESLSVHLVDSPALEKFVMELRRLMPEHVAFGQAKCDRLLRKMLELRPSNLHEQGALDRLWLPDVENLAQLTPTRSSGN